MDGAECSRHELNGREKLKRLQRYSHLSLGRILRMRCTFIIFFLFKCHFIACSAVYKTECVLRGSRVSYHLSSFVAYKHNSTRSLTYKLFTCHSTHANLVISCTKCQFSSYKKHDQAIVSVIDRFRVEIFEQSRKQNVMQLRGRSLAIRKQRSVGSGRGKKYYS